MIGGGRRLLVVEDDQLTASLLTQVLRDHGFEVGHAASAKAALETIDAFDPDAALLDIDLGDGPNGVDLGFILHRTRPHVALIFLTKHPDGRTIGSPEGDIPPGAGFLSKDRVQDADSLAAAIDAALRERIDEVRHDRDPGRPLAGLTSRQLEVLRMIALGFTNERIAKEKDASKSTVERWAKEVFEQLGIDTRSDLNPRVEATRMFIEAAGLPPR